MTKKKKKSTRSTASLLAAFDTSSLNWDRLDHSVHVGSRTILSRITWNSLPLVGLRKCPRAKATICGSGICCNEVASSRSLIAEYPLMI
jgi:hypothetical protein